VNTLAIIVNYRAAELTIKAARSVLESDSLGPVQVVVVDNSEDAGEVEQLHSALPSTVELRVSPENVGFGRACNLAFHEYPREYILLLNPDAQLLPGSLLQLQQTLRRDARVGAVAPRVFWDETREFLLPPSYPPGLMLLEEVVGISSRSRASIMSAASALWRRYAIRFWRSRSCVRVGNLSGGVVLLNARAVERAGGLFDPAFFLYFEDMDLFLRLRKAGYTLLMDPRGEAFHLYDQCDRDGWERKRSHIAISKRIFMEKHYKGWRLRVGDFSCRPRGHRTYDGKLSAAPDFDSPFALEVPESLQSGWLFEWSPNATLLPAAGRFGRGRFVRFSAECWAMLAPGRYFGRVGRPEGFGLRARGFSWKVERGDPRETACS